MSQRKQPAKPEGHKYTTQAIRKYDDPESIQERMEYMDRLENKVFEDSASIVAAFLDFGAVDKDATSPPPEWVNALGHAKAHIRLDIAKSGWLPQAQAPGGVVMAGRMMVGISQARARRYQKQQTVQQPLPVVINLPAPTSQQHPSQAPALPEKDLDE